MTAAAVECTLRGGPRTAHLIRHHLTIIPEAVELWCGRRGIPQPVTPSTWKHCQVCRRNHQDHQAIATIAAGGQDG